MDRPRSTSQCEHGYDVFEGLGNGCITCHQDEVDRLRAALRAIAAEANDGGIHTPGIVADAGRRCAYVVTMAHVALGPPPPFKFAGFSGPHPSLGVGCPVCLSPAGHYCNDGHGHPCDRPHDERRTLAVQGQKEAPSDGC